MTLLVFLTTLDALQRAQERFYSEFRFADLFADLKRAPRSVALRLEELSGVDRVETRIRAPIRLEVEGFRDPVRGEILSIPEGEQPVLNRLYLREGRLPEADRAHEVVISEPFAKAQGLRPRSEERRVGKECRERGAREE